MVCLLTEEYELKPRLIFGRGRKILSTFKCVDLYLENIRLINIVNSRKSLCYKYSRKLTLTFLTCGICLMCFLQGVEFVGHVL